jgi:hypothetical protein
MTTRRTIQRRPKRKPLRISLHRALCLLSLFVLATTIFFFVIAFHTLNKEAEKEKDSLVASVSQPFEPKRNRSIQADTRQERATANIQQQPPPQDDKLLVQQYLLRTVNQTFLPLMAHVEPPLQTGISPLPVRTKGPLRSYAYPNKIRSCQDVQNNWPVDHPKELDTTFGPNVGQLQSLYPLRDAYAAQICPVDADPFLPWIQDVFASVDGLFIEFIAHNKRRCRTAPITFADDLANLEPQVAIMQSVPVKRLTTDEQQRLVPGWNAQDQHTHRYRLASLEEADEDGRETRFLCHFHSLRIMEDGSSVQKVVLGETLSVFPYNYEHANFRKGPKPHPMLTRPKDAQDVHGAHNEQVWNSILHFKCPVPPELQEIVQSGDSVDHLNIPSIYLDLVPIRTPARETREGYCPQVPSSSFDPHKEWGIMHVLPTVEESGRWANIPLCHPPAKSIVKTPKQSQEAMGVSESPKQHYLVGCLWASAAFTTRGVGATMDTSTSERLLEWLVYHLYIAKLDHVYVYDNTEAHTNTTSLQPVLDLFPPDRVTSIPWKHRVCNNNRPAHNNAGERSSQYAAEASCRVRYGPTTEWLVSFDTDEYLIPQGNWSNLQEWLKESVKSGKIGKNTHILSFFQTRALPNVQYMEPYMDDDKCGATIDESSSKCLTKRSEATFLQAYDCESTPLPKPDFGWRAKKQIYRPSFVLNHFVHYSTVTARIHDAPDEASPPFLQRKPWERRVGEVDEAFMLHTKTTSPPATLNWRDHCQDPNKPKQCPVGIVWPLGGAKPTVTRDGLARNCYQHERIQKKLASKLQTILEPLRKQYFESIQFTG